MDKTLKQRHEMTPEEETHQECNHPKRPPLTIYHFNHMYDDDYLSIDYDKDGNITFIED